MSDLFFEEVDGDRRRVILRGSATPLGGPRRKAAFALGGELRSTRVYEPGSESPVRHVFGSKERDLEVEGHLRDGLLGDLGAAERYRGLIESIRREGQELRILWNGLARRGMLAETEFGVEGPADYTYRLRFEIDALDDGEDEQRRSQRTAFPSLDPSELAGLLSARRSAMLRIPGLSFGIAAALDELFGAVLGPLGGLVGAFEDIAAEVEDIEGAFRRAINAAAALRERVRHLAATISAQNDPSDVPDGAALAAWERQRSEALMDLREVAARSLALGIEAERRLAGSTSGRVVEVRDGDTIESIAARERVSAEAIRALNPSAPFAPAAGTKLKLP